MNATKDDAQLDLRFDDPHNFCNRCGAKVVGEAATDKRGRLYHRDCFARAFGCFVCGKTEGRRFYYAPYAGGIICGYCVRKFGGKAT